MPESLTFPHFFLLCLQDACCPKMCAFLSAQRFLLLCVCLRNALVYKMYGLACVPLSLLMSSCMPVLMFPPRGVWSLTIFQGAKS